MAKAKSTNAAANDARRQILRATTDSVIKSKFASTLGKEEDITNIFLALMLLESSFNVNATGKEVNESISSGARDYWNSTPVKTVRQNGSPPQKNNVFFGKKAIGVAQVMGWNLVRGASVKTGKCEVERLRPDLASELCVDAGDDILAKYLGDANLSTAITAGLVILEGKWKSCVKTSEGWKVGSKVFPLRISAAIAAYLGLGAKDVVTGLTPEAYTASIVGGKKYAEANGTSSPAVRDSQIQVASRSAKGPVITIASNKNLSVPGCTKKEA